MSAISRELGTEAHPATEGGAVRTMPARPRPHRIDAPPRRAGQAQAWFALGREAGHASGPPAIHAPERGRAILRRAELALSDQGRAIARRSALSVPSDAFVTIGPLRLSPPKRPLLIAGPLPKAGPASLAGPAALAGPASVGRPGPIAGPEPANDDRARAGRPSRLSRLLREAFFLALLALTLAATFYLGRMHGHQNVIVVPEPVSHTSRLA